MAGFIRRFTSQPSVEVLSEIEAIDIVDLTPQSPTTGTGTGTLLCVGEFEDGPFAAGGDAAEFAGETGVVEVFGSEDLALKYGTFGFSYGGVPYENPCARRHLFENWNGNGFIKLKYCRPRRLLIARVDTSVGEVSFSPLASILGGSSTVALSPADTLYVETDVGGTPTAPVVVGAPFVASGFLGGEQIDIDLNGSGPTTVTFGVLDQTPAQVAAVIDAAFPGMASVVLGALNLTGTVVGPIGGSIVLSEPVPGVLAAIGLVAGSTSGLDAGNSTPIAAAVANVTGAIFVNSGFIGGESITIAVDGGPTVSVVFASADQTPAQVAARISLVLGYAAAADVGGALDLVGIVAGTDGELVLADGSVGALAAIGLAAGTTAGTGNVGNINAITPAEIAAIINASASLVAINASASIDDQGRLRLFRSGGPGTIYLYGGAMASALAFDPIDATVTAGEHAGGTIAAGTRVSDGTSTWVTMQTLTVAAGTALAPNLGPHTVKVRPATDDGTATGVGSGTVTSVLDMPTFSDLSVTNANALTNALTEPAMDAAYDAAFARTIDLSGSVREINFSISARRSPQVVTTGRQNAIDASSQGMFGRKFITGAALGVTRAQARADVAQYRSDRLFYTYPGWKVRVSEIAFRGAAGGTGFTEDGVIVVRGDGPLATLDCQLAPEENPGQATGLIENFFEVEPVIESGQRVALSIADYTAFKAAGICAPRRDQTSGSVYQSGVTSNITAGLTTQARRKMADFIQDSLAVRLVPFSKRLATPAQRDAIYGIIEQFLAELQSVNNPETARIDSYLVDAKSGQTPELTARGIFVFIVKVRTLSSLDAIVLQTEIGEGVVTVAQQA